MDEWIARQHTLITVARDTQLASDAHALVEYDPRITEYPVHSYVLFTPPVGRSNKLLPRHRGPYQVMEKTDSIYVIEDLVSGKHTTTHIHNLRDVCKYLLASSIYLSINSSPTQRTGVHCRVDHRPPWEPQSTILWLSNSAKLLRWADVGIIIIIIRSALQSTTTS